MIGQTDITVSLRSEFIGRKVHQAILYTPEEDSQMLPVNTADGRVQVAIPKLTFWGILSLK